MIFYWVEVWIENVFICESEGLLNLVGWKSNIFKIVSEKEMFFVKKEVW